MCLKNFIRSSDLTSKTSIPMWTLAKLIQTNKTKKWGPRLQQLLQNNNLFLLRYGVKIQISTISTSRHISDRYQPNILRHNSSPHQPHPRADLQDSRPPKTLPPLHSCISILLQCSKQPKSKQIFQSSNIIIQMKTRAFKALTILKPQPLHVDVRVVPLVSRASSLSTTTMMKKRSEHTRSVSYNTCRHILTL